jgi:hypothetical protein
MYAVCSKSIVARRRGADSCAPNSRDSSLGRPHVMFWFNWMSVLLLSLPISCAGTVVIVSDSGSIDAGGDASDDMNTFPCGGDVCLSHTQMCAILMTNVNIYSCVDIDGGFSCEGVTMIAASPGACGCFQSPTGNVTLTTCE